MSNWEEIDEDSPFAATPQVDGLVYSPTDHSPELAMGAGAYAPPPPPRQFRPAPQRPQPDTVEPWNPAPAESPAAFRPKRQGTNPVKVLVLGMLPILIAAGIVYGVMSLYGDLL